MIHLSENVELRIRTRGSFVVMVDGVLVGPDSGDARVFVVRAAGVEREIEIVPGEPEVPSLEFVELPNPLDDVDPVPMEIPLALQEPQTMREIIAQYVREENMKLQGREDMNYVETEEEAEDFEVDDEPSELLSEEEYRQMVEDRWDEINNEKSLTDSKDSGKVVSPTAEVKNVSGNGEGEKGTGSSGGSDRAVVRETGAVDGSGGGAQRTDRASARPNGGVGAGGDKDQKG